MTLLKKKINFILQLFNSNKLIEAKKEIDQQLRKKKSSVLFNILGAVLWKIGDKFNSNYAQCNLGLLLSSQKAIGKSKEQKNITNQ